MFFDREKNIDRLIRLGDVFVRPLFLPPEFIAVTGFGCRDDDRNSAELGVLLQVTAYLESVFVRHDHVKNNQVHRHRAGLFLGLFAVPGGDDLVGRTAESYNFV